MYFVFLAKYPGQVEEAEKKTLQTLQMILKEQDERGTGVLSKVKYSFQAYSKCAQMRNIGGRITI